MCSKLLKDGVWMKGSIQTRIVAVLQGNECFRNALTRKGNNRNTANTIVRRFVIVNVPGTALFVLPVTHLRPSQIQQHVTETDICLRYNW